MEIEKPEPTREQIAHSYANALRIINRLTVENAALRDACRLVLGHLDGSTGEVDAVDILQRALAEGR